METFKERLKLAMIDAGKTQTDIANETNIPRSTITQYVGGRVIPRYNRLEQLAKTLGVSPRWLLGYDDKDGSRPSAEKDTANLPIYTDDELIVAYHLLTNMNKHLLRQEIIEMLREQVDELEEYKGK